MSITFENQEAQFVEAAASLGIAIDGLAASKFARLATLLEEGNRRLNLTRVAPEDVMTLHFLDSLAAAAVWRPQPEDRLIDVGTGPGFPGLALAIAFPNLEVTLLDGTRKKLDFIDQVISELSIHNARTLHGRAEVIGRMPKHRGAYDTATARAVAKLPELTGWMLPLVRPGGIAIAYKSRDVEAEVAEARRIVARLGGEFERVAQVQLPTTEIVRTMVVIRKAVSPVRSAVHQKGKPRQ